MLTANSTARPCDAIVAGFAKLTPSQKKDALRRMQADPVITKAADRRMAEQAKGGLKGATFVQQMFSDAARCIHKTLTQNLNCKKRAWINTCDPDALQECLWASKWVKRDIEKAIEFLEVECERVATRQAG